MKIRFDPLLAAIVLAASGPALAEHGLTTNIITISHDHWFWLARVAEADPGYLPKDYDGRIKPFHLYDHRSANQLYKACGIEMGKGERFIYGAPTSQLILRLSPENFRRVGLIHKTMAAWKAGRVKEWHHETARWHHITRQKLNHILAGLSSPRAPESRC